MKQKYTFFLLLLAHFITPLQAQDKELSLLELKERLSASTGEYRLKMLNAVAQQSYLKGPAQARDYMLEAVQLAKELQIDQAEAEALRVVGMTFFDEGSLDSAMSYYAQAMRKYRSISDEEGVGRMHCCFNCIYRSTGNYELAISEAITALEIYRSIGDTAQWSVMLHDIGLTNFQLKNYDVAMDYFKQAIKMSEKLSISLGNVFRNMARVYIAHGDYTQAILLLEKALAPNNRAEEGWSDRVYKTYLALGEANLKSGNVTQALAYYHIAVDLTASQGRMIDLGTAYNGVGAAYTKRQNQVQARRYLSKARNVFMKHNIQVELAQNALAFSDYYEQFNLPDSAQLYASFYEKHQDSIHTQQNEARYAELMAKQKIGEKEFALQVANHEMQLQQMEAMIATKWNIVLTLSLIALSIMMCYLIMMVFKLKASNKTLILENQEIVDHETELKAVEQRLDRVNHEIVRKEVELDNRLTEDQKMALLDQLIEVFEVDKVYRQGDITVIKLAEVLGTNKTYLSLVINEKLSKNFSNVINEYRVRDARMMLTNEDYNHLTIEGISNTCGFNSKSAFNKAFKKFTGYTPSFYIDSRRQMPILN